MSKGINPNLKYRSRKLRTVEEYNDGLVARDRFILSEILTLIESTNPNQRKLGEQVLYNIGEKGEANSLRIGITGSPGAGKSTFIESLGTYLTSVGKKVAVLAIDPSSTKTDGSILGDKTRMSKLSTNPDAFIRPTATANILGGVARATKESISICEAAGYDVILIESVGVGQSETDLADLVDMYMLLLLPGGGDGVQGIKRGVVELADMLVINKYDGDRKLIAEKSKKDFSASIGLFHHELPDWSVPVELCSSLENKRISNVWERIQEFEKLSKSSSFFNDKRKQQNARWMDGQIKNHMSSRAKELFSVDKHLQTKVKKDLSIFQRLDELIYKIDEDYHRYKQK